MAILSLFHRIETHNLSKQSAAKNRLTTKLNKEVVKKSFILGNEISTIGKQNHQKKLNMFLFLSDGKVICLE